MKKLDISRLNGGSTVLYKYLPLSMVFTFMLYSCSNKNKPSAQTTQLISQIDSANSNQDSLNAQLSAARLLIDQLKTQNTTLDSALNNDSSEIVKLKREVGHYKHTSWLYASRLKKAKKLISKLQEDAQRFAERFGLLQSDNNDLSRQRDSLSQEYTNLKQLASVLHASDIRLTALKVKHSGKEKKTVRARKVRLLRIVFDIDKNRIAEDGNKKLYLVIKGPKGNILTNNFGSGTMHMSDGTITQYSIMDQVALKKDEPVKNVTVNWKQNSRYQKGAYDIEIFNSGYEIGDGTVVLK